MTESNITPSWVVGGNAEQAQTVRGQEVKDRQAKMVRRFFMKVNSDTEITFVGPFILNGSKFEPFVIREHQFAVFDATKRKLDWHNFRTCLRGNGDGRCPYCEAGIKSYVANYFTIIDHTKWADNQGNEHKDEKKLLMLKGEVADIILKQIAKRGGTLKGLRYEVTRPNDAQSSSTGTNYSFSAPNDLGQYKAEQLEPYNMFDILKPVTVEQAAAEIAQIQRSENAKAAREVEEAGDDDAKTTPFAEGDQRVAF